LIITYGFRNNVSKEKSLRNYKYGSMFLVLSSLPVLPAIEIQEKATLQQVSQSLEKTCTVKLDDKKCKKPEGRP